MPVLIRLCTLVCDEDVLSLEITVIDILVEEVAAPLGELQ